MAGLQQRRGRDAAPLGLSLVVVAKLLGKSRRQLDHIIDDTTDFPRVFRIGAYPHVRTHEFRSWLDTRPSYEKAQRSA